MVGVCFRSQEAKDNEIDKLFECFRLPADGNRRLLIMGDFNYPDINWNSLRSDHVRRKFLQDVHQPTRLNNILDPGPKITPKGYWQSAV